MDSSQPSLFLSILPKEIRLQIYALILGNNNNNTIHILPTSDGLIHTLCCCPNSDKDVYHLQTSQDVSVLPAWDEVYFANDDRAWIRTYARRHERCLRLLKSLYWRRYDPWLYMEGGEVEWERKSSRARTKEAATALIKTFGKFDKESLGRLHPRSFIWGLSSLSLVCKVMYFEVREVVFRQNWFSLMVNSKWVGEAFRQFEPWQLAAMRKLQLKTTFDVERGFSLRPSEMARLVRMLPGLVELGLDIIDTKEDVATAFQLELEQHDVERPIVARARVVVGCDDVSEWICRSWRKNQARRIESSLTGARHESLGGDGEAVGVINTERRLEMLEIPNVGPEGERERMIHVLREQRVMWI